MTIATTGPRPADAPWYSRRPWLVVLLAGGALLLISSVVTGITEDTVLMPAVILVGSFLVPVATVAFALTRKHDGHLSAETILLAFLLGGTLGLVSAALLETYLLPRADGTFLMVGLIEEVTKGAVLLGVAHWCVKSRKPLDGLVLGAVVGAGFAAFESSGYALNVLLSHVASHPVLNILETEASRAILSPFGHITWTALLGGALFYTAREDGRFRLTKGLFWTFAGVVALHAAWDASYGWSIVVTQGLVGDGWSWTLPNASHWVGSPTGDDLAVFNIVYNGLLIINATIGAMWVAHKHRFFQRLRPAEPAPAPAVVVTAAPPLAS
ncbi:MAG TPA: PrsW family glutamic-type intramembrane protease [Acidimicrobiales bacterium]|nr:PrsW family glutamic-type intramembrane protease [Acidimicrobiales bacterium]